MGRPKKKERHKPTNLTLDPEIKRQAKKLAHEKNTSLSEIVCDLLEKFVAKNASNHGLKIGTTLTPAAQKFRNPQCTDQSKQSA